MPLRTGNFASCVVEPAAHIGQKFIRGSDMPDNAVSIPSEMCSPPRTSSSGDRRTIPSCVHAAERLRLADLGAAVVKVSPGDSAGALAGDRVRQNRDDGAEPLAVEFVERCCGVRLPEAGSLAPAERVDVLERPLDRPMVHIDLADVAQVSLSWRACDGLQAGDDSRRAHFLARPVFGFLSAPLRLSRLTRCGLLGRRLASFPSDVLPIRASTASGNEQPLRCIFERDDVAAYSASAAVPDVLAWAGRESVVAAADGASADAARAP